MKSIERFLRTFVLGKMIEIESMSHSKTFIQYKMFSIHDVGLLVAGYVISYQLNMAFIATNKWKESSNHFSLYDRPSVIFHKGSIFIFLALQNNSLYSTILEFYCNLFLKT